MTPETTIATLDSLAGQDLLTLARRHGVVARGQERLDKGWASRTISAILGGRGNVRTVALRRSPRSGSTPREALALAPVELERIAETPFSQSRLAAALSDLVVVAREDERGRSRRRSRLLGVRRFNLRDSRFLYKLVERDYEQVRAAVRAGQPLTGHLGALVQPRTKGRGGDAPRQFAFYARAPFVGLMLGLNEI